MCKYEEDFMKVNCWEHMGCGREVNGSKVNELGVCVAAMENKLDGVHGGVNGGRTCWAVAGTLCGGEVQGTFADKMGNCRTCDFYNAVFHEELANFSSITELISKIKQ